MGHDHNIYVGQDINTICGLKPLGIRVDTDPKKLFHLVDVVIDFTTPNSSVKHAEIAAEKKKN